MARVSVSMGIDDAGAASKGLKSGALGLLSSIVMAIASTAPAYSLAATLGVVAIAVGIYSPAIMILAFLPMLFIAIAYQELNQDHPDCGTTFTWAAKALGPRIGWMGGWGVIAADVIVMANLAEVAGRYFYLLFGATALAQDAFWVAVLGCIWIALMTWVCYIGIEVSARLQRWLVGIEVGILLLFSVVALVKVYSGNGTPGSIKPSWEWFNPFGIHSFSAFAQGTLVAIFIYWGWDTAVAVNEETEDKNRTPGRAAVISTVLLLVTYAVVTVAAQAYAGTGTTGLGLANEAHSGDVLSALGYAVLGTTLGKLLIFMTLTSAAASSQTTILPTARTTLAMAVYRAIPKVFADIHPRYMTPTWSTIVMGVVSITFYLGLTLVSDNVLADSISSVGLMVAFYYGLTGFACVWYFRRTLFASFRNFLLRGLLPLIGSIVLLIAFMESARDMFSENYGATSFMGIGGVFLIGAGTLLLGIVLMELYRLRAPAYFRGEVLNASTQAMVTEEGEVVGSDEPTSNERLVEPSSRHS
ncbi:MAG: APC family permease [Pseudomonadota bacterium]|nr:APC family permease [Pseudomonadota bacterium]